MTDRHQGLADELSVRLGELPRKVRLPLGRLQELGQIDEESLAVILDAGELSSNAAHLLGFAAGFLSMKSRGIPVGDVVKMAKRQRRRIRLDWSAKRWQAEHDRLSRAETLVRLAADNVQYDVARFRRLLPARFSGYLVSSSRRLGMEGLRQRHCVAGHHDSLVAGRFAIASVFVDRQRWTVQLFTTDDPEQPLRLGQIKTRLNGEPTTEIRRRIRETLGLPEIEAKPVEDAAECRHFYVENLRRVLPILQGHGVRLVTVDFSGYGDSGAIEGVSYDPPEFDGAAAASGLVSVASVHSVFDGTGWARNRVVAEKTLSDALTGIAEDYLSFSNVDWYNDDGGYGTLEIDVAAGTAELDVNVRYTEAQTEFYQELDIENGEVL